MNRPASQPAIAPTITNHRRPIVASFRINFVDGGPLRECGSGHDFEKALRDSGGQERG
jgi:hypothetical protein